MRQEQRLARPQQPCEAQGSTPVPSLCAVAIRLRIRADTAPERARLGPPQPKTSSPPPLAIADPRYVAPLVARATLPKCASEGQGSHRDPETPTGYFAGGRGPCLFAS